MNITLSVALYGFASTILTVVADPGAISDDVTKGRKLAQTVCSGYHEIATGAGWTNAPSFPEIANRPRTTTTSLEVIIQK
jgi:hypothetical protein